MGSRHISGKAGAFILVGAMALTAASAARAAIVANGGFETTNGGPTIAADWTVPAGDNFNRLPTGGVGGSAAEELINTAPASAAGPFRQDTVLVGGDSAAGGVAYTFSFDSLRTETAGGVFQAQRYATDNVGDTIGGPVINDTLTNGNTAFETTSLPFTSPAGTVGFQINFYPITGGATGTESDVILDNVAITGPGAVPEPASLSLLALGGLGLIRRRRLA